MTQYQRTIIQEAVQNRDAKNRIEVLAFARKHDIELGQSSNRDNLLVYDFRNYDGGPRVLRLTDWLLDDGTIESNQWFTLKWSPVDA